MFRADAVRREHSATEPMQANGEPEPVPSAEYVERIQAYMTKALKEAKINTSWIQPNEEWDAAMHDFIAKILDSSARNKFLPIFLPFLEFAVFILNPYYANLYPR